MADLETINLLMTGVGGQGVILASDIVGEVAMAAEYDFKKTDTLGMAQRGGSVTSHIRIAPKVWSPLIEEGKVDILLALEKLEAARWAHYIKPGGIAIVNDLSIPPVSVNLGNEVYPNDNVIMDAVKRTADRLYFIAGFEKVQQLGNMKALNTLMLGCVSRFLPMDIQLWKDCIARRLPASVLEINEKAFDAGRGEIADSNLR